VRSLAVDGRFIGRGIGRQLVEWCVEEARRLHIRKLMSLTYEQRFFEKLGFEVVPKESLPLKVWSDCVRCPKREGCDEIAMVRVLHDVSIVELPAAPPTPRGVSIPVLEYVEED
jgi:amino-acid N-acetyltransferase